MDSGSRLDYALFQLTPTRTRCDLIICAGDCKEKLASGLLDPFIAHLKFAKDQISKGGYSITLSASASWFTKSTIERFVRFVSTPDVLERFITIEREITNIDCSINTNASSDTQTVYGLDEHSNKSAAYAYKHDAYTRDAIHEEDSKVHLQRVLETRKAVLQREQAMVYARALVAGFETDNLQDLICFADAFGSPRLREACLNFMELCNTKSNDRVWMDEVAAMQAYSRSQYFYTESSGRIVIPGEDNVLNGNFTTKKQNSSVDVTETESSKSHGSHFPQYMYTYQGYPFPGMTVPPYYQGNIPWPPNMEDSRNRGKRSHKKGSQDGDFDSSDSSCGSDSDRSSTQKVVIRNINYITSDANQDLDTTIEDNCEDQNVTHQWNIFQNLLMKDADEKESERDSFIENKNHVNNLRSGKDLSPFIKKFEVPNIIPPGTRPIGKYEEGDWFLRSPPDKIIQEKSRDIMKDVLVNDPLAVKARSLNEMSDSQLKTRDILMASESNLTQKKVNSTFVNEPNDLYMVPERDTSGQQAVTGWTPEMELGHNKETKSMTKNLVKKGIERKGSTIESKSKPLVGSLGNTKPDVASRSKKSTTTKMTIAKGKSNKEEEKRKKTEELLTQREKRIAQRSASTVNTSKNEKPRAQLPSRDMKKSIKPVIKSSTIDRLSAARVVNPKVLPTESKHGNKLTKATIKKNVESKPTKVITKDKCVSRASFSQRTTGAEKKKVKPEKVEPLDKNIGSKNSNGSKKKKIADINNFKQLPRASLIKKTQSDNTKSVIETLHKASLVLQKDIAKMNHEIPVIEISKAPPAKTSPERSNSRKKWSNVDQTSTKALNGLKKLLSFGRSKTLYS